MFEFNLYINLLRFAPFSNIYSMKHLTHLSKPDPTFQTFEGFGDFGSFIDSSYNTKKDDVLDFYNDPMLNRFFSGEEEDQRKCVKMLNKVLKEHVMGMGVFYHGTNPEHDIMGTGLLKTSSKSKRSMQSQTGFTYLTIYPAMAKTFGDMAYSINDAAVYQVTVPIIHLKPDLDQLRNRRQYAGDDCGNSLADSLIYGKGVRVQGNIPLYMIKPFEA